MASATRLAALSHNPTVRSDSAARNRCCSRRNSRTTLRELLSATEIFSTLSPKEIGQRISYGLRNPLTVLVVKKNIRIGDFTLTLKAIV